MCMSTFAFCTHVCTYIEVYREGYACLHGWMDVSMDGRMDV